MAKVCLYACVCCDLVYAGLCLRGLHVSAGLKSSCVFCPPFGSGVNLTVMRLLLRRRPDRIGILNERIWGNCGAYIQTDTTEQ